MSLSNIAKAPYIHRGADGKDYTFSPLGFRELGQYVNWYQFRRYHIARENGLDKAELRAIYDECSQNTINLTSPEVLASFTTLDGIAKLLYLSIKIKHPNVSESDLSSIISFEDFVALSGEVLNITGLANASVDNGEESLGELQPSQTQENR